MKIGGSLFFAETFNEKESLSCLDDWRKFVLTKVNSDNQSEPETTADDEEEERPEVQLIVVGKFETETAKDQTLQWALKFSNF